MKEELDNCQKMKNAELKQELTERGISTASFFEKSEFVKALAAARVDGVTKQASGGSGSSSEGYAEYADVEVLTSDDAGPRPKGQQQQQQQSPFGGAAGGNPFGGAAGGNPFGGAAGGNPFGGAAGMGGMGGMGGIADMLKNMGMGGMGGAAGGANPFAGGAGAAGKTWEHGCMLKHLLNSCSFSSHIAIPIRLLCCRCQSLRRRRRRRNGGRHGQGHRTHAKSKSARNYGESPVQSKSYGGNARMHGKPSSLRQISK